MTFTAKVQEIAAGCSTYYELLHALVMLLRRHWVLELGTGAGGSGAAMMRALPDIGVLCTVNWPNPPSGDDVGVVLNPWDNDPRLFRVLGDTRDEAVVKQVRASAPYDFLFIDSGTTHDFPLISAEWVLYEPMLVGEAVVCVDDLDFPGGGIRRFWDALPYEKVELPVSTYGFGVFLYRRAT